MEGRVGRRRPSGFVFRSKIRAAVQNLHVQALCDATYVGPDGSTERGIGILEQLAIGVHPTGLVGIFDPYTPSADG